MVLDVPSPKPAGGAEIALLDHVAPPNRFLLNLERRPDRLAHSTAECARAGLDVCRIIAIDGQHLSRDTPRGLSPINGRRLKLSEMACAQSHRALWQHGASRGVAILVLEDDVRFCPDIHQLLRRPLLVPDDFGVLYLGCSHLEELPVETPPAFRELRSCRTTHAYLASSRACHTLVELTHEQPYLAADHYTMLAHQLRRVRAHVLTPMWAVQADFTSDIGLRLSTPAPVLAAVDTVKAAPVSAGASACAPQ